MMTSRAKRMRKFLTELGWTIDADASYQRCSACNAMDYSSTKFCGHCGAKRKKQKPDESGLRQLEDAIAYALGETKGIPSK